MIYLRFYQSTMIFLFNCVACLVVRRQVVVVMNTCNANGWVSDSISETLKLSFKTENTTAKYTKKFLFWVQPLFFQICYKCDCLITYISTYVNFKLIRVK